MEHWVSEMMIEKIKTILLSFFDFSKKTPQEYYLSHPPSSLLEKKIHTFSHANHVLSSFSYFLNDETIHQNYQYIKKKYVSYVQHGMQHVFLSYQARFNSYM